jgi:hypothetical protein
MNNINHQATRAQAPPFPSAGAIGNRHKKRGIEYFLAFIQALNFIGGVIGVWYLGTLGVSAPVWCLFAAWFFVPVLTLAALQLAVRKALEAEAIATHNFNTANNMPLEYMHCISLQDQMNVAEEIKRRRAAKEETARRLLERIELEKEEKDEAARRPLELIKLEKERRELDRKEFWRKELGNKSLLEKHAIIREAWLSKDKSIRHLLYDFDEGLDLVFYCASCQWWRPQKNMDLVERDSRCPNCQSELHYNCKDVPKP